MKFPTIKVVDLRERIEIRSPARVPDGLGGYTETWSKRGTVWARIDIWDQQEGPSRYKVFIRKGISLFPRYRVIWRGMPFKILGLLKEDAKGEWAYFWMSALETGETP